MRPSACIPRYTLERARWVPSVKKDKPSRNNGALLTDHELADFIWSVIERGVFLYRIQVRYEYSFILVKSRRWMIMQIHICINQNLVRQIDPLHFSSSY